MEIPEDVLALQRSDVHVLFGPNNVGKSRLLKVLAEASFSTTTYWLHGTFHEEPQHPYGVVTNPRKGQPVAVIYDPRQSPRVRLDREGQKVVGEELKGSSNPAAALKEQMESLAKRLGAAWPRRYIPANRYFRHFQEIDTTPVASENLSTENAVVFFGELQNHPDAPRRAMFEQIASAFEEITGYTFHVRQAARNQLAQIGEGTNERALAECGDGLRDLAMLLLYVVTQPDAELFIDDPGIRLHPGAQRRLLRFLLKHSQNRAIWLATHDAIFLGAREIGLRLAVTRSDGVTRVRALAGFADVAAALGEAGWQAKDLLFSDSVLLCEGPSDRVVFRAAIEDIGGVDLDGTVVAALGGGLKGRAPELAATWLRDTFGQAVPNGRIVALLDSKRRSEDDRLRRRLKELRVPVSFMSRGELEDYWAANDDLVVALVVDQATQACEDPADVPSAESVSSAVHEMRQDVDGTGGLDFLKRVFDKFQLQYRKVEAAEFVALRSPPELRREILQVIISEIRGCLAAK
jgi:energy-coupling factor transporter ATP-binding protein EcfA2